MNKIKKDEQIGSENQPYFKLFRPEIFDLIPKTTKRLLDIGCAEGVLANEARKKYDLEIAVGIELNENAAKVARTKLDKVLVGDIENMNLDFSERYFDCIICADILEHLKDPWKVLSYLKNILDNDGTVIISLPNLRHIVPVLKIIFNRFEYTDSGILDRTHLRFFTLHTMKKMIDECGFRIESINSNKSISYKFRLINFLSFGLFTPFSIYQYIFLLKKKEK
ncbi:MAG: class I SAM-dependent methyltransferase [Ignavibacteriales bacterium]|nr:class I SAM-dependent methyltransferase [Ignavibacteriales bacterium]